MLLLPFVLAPNLLLVLGTAAEAVCGPDDLAGPSCDSCRSPSDRCWPDDSAGEGPGDASQVIDDNGEIDDTEEEVKGKPYLDPLN